MLSTLSSVSFSWSIALLLSSFHSLSISYFSWLRSILSLCSSSLFLVSATSCPRKLFGCVFPGTSIQSVRMNLVQVGGSDQTGNITTGYQLITKLLPEKQAFGLMTPLLTDEMGSKYGKSTGSRVWLSRNKMSPFDFYQYFVRVHDMEILKFLKLFTFFSDAEIETIMGKFLKKTDSRYAQERLAEAVTLLVHGEEGLSSAKKTTDALYNNDLEAVSKMTVEEMQEVFGSSTLVTHLYLNPEETTVLDASMQAKCFPNPTYASGVIRAGGFFINNKRVTDPLKLINEEEDILPNDTSLIRVGKRRYYIIKWRWRREREKDCCLKQVMLSLVSHMFSQANDTSLYTSISLLRRKTREEFINKLSS